METLLYRVETLLYRLLGLLRCIANPRWWAKNLRKGIQTLIGIMVGSDLEPIAAVADSVFECETGAELFVRHFAPDLADKTG